MRWYNLGNRRDKKMASEQQFFPLDGHIVRYLPRAGATLNHPNAKMPSLRHDEEKGVWFLEMTFSADAGHPSEAEVTRRIPLDNLSDEDWQNLQHWYEQFDFKEAIRKGISKSLDEIDNVLVQRLFMSLLTFLNPRQVAILLYLYRNADPEGKVEIVTEDLLDQLGYSRCNDGGFTSEARGRLNRDLVSLHRMELVYPDPDQDICDYEATFVVKRIMTIEKFKVNKRNPETFDWGKAADYTHELAAKYFVTLGFYDTIKRGSDYLLLPDDIDLRQKTRSQPEHNYKMKMLTYIISRMTWDGLKDGQFLVISQSYIFKILELLGSNVRRHKKILWDAIEELKMDGFLVNAQENVNSRGQASIRFTLNQDKIKHMKKTHKTLRTQGK